MKLAPGWTAAKDSKTGRTYYFDDDGKARWNKPLRPKEEEDKKDEVVVVPDNNEQTQELPPDDAVQSPSLSEDVVPVMATDHNEETSRSIDPESDEQQPGQPEPETTRDGNRSLSDIDDNQEEELESHQVGPEQETPPGTNIVQPDDPALDDEESEGEEEALKRQIKTVEDARRLATMASRDRFESVANLPDLPDPRQVLLQDADAVLITETYHLMT